MLSSQGSLLVCFRPCPSLENLALFLYLLSPFLVISYPRSRLLTREISFISAIKYPPLEKDRRLIVWRRFFELAGCSVDHNSERVTEADLDWLASKPFNGACSRASFAPVSSARCVSLVVANSSSLLPPSGFQLRLKSIRSLRNTDFGIAYTITRRLASIGMVSRTATLSWILLSSDRRRHLCLPISQFPLILVDAYGALRRY